MAGKIFINYRRGDDPGFTQALYQRLEDEFAARDLFMDVEGQIRPGDDFVAVLNSHVAECDVLLAVIGPRWEELLAPRAGDAEDFVMIEIKAALDQGKRVIPVLVGAAAMPRVEALPVLIRPLARRNAVGLRPERFKADCQGLVTALREQLAAAERERAPHSRAGRAAAEDERRTREGEEAARLAAVEARLEEVVWEGLGPNPDRASLVAFLQEYPKGAHAGAERERIAALERQATAHVTRRRLIKTMASGAIATSAAGGALYAAHATLTPGQPIWRLLHDQSLRTFSGHRSWVKSIAITPDGKHVISGSSDNTVKVWELASGREIQTLTGHLYSVNSVAATPDGRNVVSGSSDGTIKVWELATGRPLRTLLGHSGEEVTCVAVSEGRYVISGGSDSSIRVWELATGSLLRTFSGHSASVSSVASLAVTPDGRHVISSGIGFGDVISIWELGSGHKLRTLSAKHDFQARSMRVTPDSRRIIYGASDIIMVREVENGSEVRTFQDGIDTVMSIAVSPDGLYVISGSFGHKVRFWELATGLLLRTLSGHSGEVTCVAVTPNGRHVVSGSADETIKVWELVGLLG
jgi:TIR domain/WD domain, G-beta repeat